jgi:hypothetical protein
MVERLLKDSQWYMNMGNIDRQQSIPFPLVVELDLEQHSPS